VFGIGSLDLDPAKSAGSPLLWVIRVLGYGPTDEPHDAENHYSGQNIVYTANTPAKNAFYTYFAQCYRANMLSFRGNRPASDASSSGKLFTHQQRFVTVVTKNLALKEHVLQNLTVTVLVKLPLV
jgi:hypothetical protein